MAPANVSGLVDATHRFAMTRRLVLKARLRHDPTCALTLWLRQTELFDGFSQRQI